MREMKFLDLPQEEFPFTIEFRKDDVLVHTITVTGPGVVDVPALGPGHEVRLICADGTIWDTQQKKGDST